MSIEEEAPTNTDSIVVSVQEGDLNLVNDFLENGGEANTCDSDGIPLLHWAAINNRLEIAKSLLLKNADVNATTGALLSTPLHWAAREGNLEIIKLLIEHGADILKSDGEGNSALHTAAALGHSSIVAYLIAKGVDSNLPNSNNKTTPLMVAVVDKKNTETCLLLLSLGASPYSKDISGNTALHWAFTSNNNGAVRLFNYEGLDFTICNEEGVSPWSPGDCQPQWMEHKLWRRIVDEHNSEKLFGRFKVPDVIKLVMTICLPGIILPLIGWIFHASFHYFYKTLAFLSLMIFTTFISNNFMDKRCSKILPISLFLSVLLMMCILNFYPLLQQMGVAYTCWILPLKLILVWLFYKCSISDPGKVPTMKKEQKETIISLGDANKLNGKNLCYSCLIQRPLRSYHCWKCKRCIAKFDHHCVWFGNCIGAKNHAHFIYFLAVHIVVGTLYLYACISFWMGGCNATVYNTLQCNGFISLTAIIATIFSVFSFFLLSIQLFQILILSRTTYELSFKIQSSYSRKVTKKKIFKNITRNCYDFFEIECCGLFKRPYKDWTRIYEERKVAAEKMV